MENPPQAYSLIVARPSWIPAMQWNNISWAAPCHTFWIRSLFSLKCTKCIEKYGVESKLRRFVSLLGHGVQPSMKKSLEGENHFCDNHFLPLFKNFYKQQQCQSGLHLDNSWLTSYTYFLGPIWKYTVEKSRNHLFQKLWEPEAAAAVPIFVCTSTRTKAGWHSPNSYTYFLGLIWKLKIYIYNVEKSHNYLF